MPESGPFESNLVVTNLSVRFGGLTALSDVSLTVRRNEVVGVIGPNGAGKTTLFNAVCGLVRPSAGTIDYEGRRLRRHRPHDLARLGIARTLQGLGLWHGLTVLENVMAGAHCHARADVVSALLGLPRSSTDEARLRGRSLDVLERLGIADTRAALPSTLPYAVQKRVALARALVVAPRLLLLDEPASGLSQEEMRSLASLVGELRAETAVLLVEHHMDFVMEVCERLVVLDFGQVIASGPPQRVRTDPLVITAYLGSEVSGEGRRDA